MPAVKKVKEFVQKIFFQTGDIEPSMGYDGAVMKIISPERVFSFAKAPADGVAPVPGNSICVAGWHLPGGADHVGVAPDGGGPVLLKKERNRRELWFLCKAF